MRAQVLHCRLHLVPEKADMQLPPHPLLAVPVRQQVASTRMDLSSFFDTLNLICTLGH